MDEIVDRVVDHLIPEVGGVTVFLENEPKKRPRTEL